MAFLVTKGVKNQTPFTGSKWFQIESMHHEGQNLKILRLQPNNFFVYVGLNHVWWLQKRRKN